MQDISTHPDSVSACPMPPARDDRKTAAIAAQRVRLAEEKHRVGGFSQARAILRSAAMKQAGLAGAEYAMDNPEHAPVFFLDGEPHRRKRAAIARFFTPRAIETRHQRVMEETTGTLLAELRAKGSACLDQMAWHLAVSVAGEVVGLSLDLGERQKLRLARDIEGIMQRTRLVGYTGLKYRVMDLFYKIRALRFHFRHVLPAIRARRKTPREDIITHLLAEHYSPRGILMECMTYAGAGMVTTREFIVIAAWHLLERPDLRSRYLASGWQEQTAILEEILRLEPVATLLYRAAETSAPALPEGTRPGETYALDLRRANVDEAATGPCPFALDPDRARRMRGSGACLSFGDGAHRCPGAQLALTETRIFIDHLLRLPGIRLATPPRIDWNDALMSYELRGAIVTCDG